MIISANFKFPLYILFGGLPFSACFSPETSSYIIIANRKTPVVHTHLFSDSSI